MTTLTPDATVHVDLGTRSYDIAITSGRLTQFAAVLEEWSQRAGFSSRLALVVTDEHLAASHATTVSQSLEAGGWKQRTIVLPPGEPTKSIASTETLYDALVSLPADRATCVIAVGGGVIGDLAGFAAATYARGIPFVQVPTSLLAQVDSSVGGKVGINHPRGKNLIGAFHQPLGVMIDTDVLQTLPDRDYRSGMAEVVKYGVILDAEFFAYLEAHVAELNAREPAVLREIVRRSCRLKADVVEKDEYERTGLRAVLNYGHTFAHAFEALCGYGELQHGEAVSIGMLYASRLAERLGRIEADVTRRQLNLLTALHIPTELPAGTNWPTDDILDRMRLDKKTVSGQLRFVLPSRLGAMETVKGVDESLVRAVLEDR